MAEVVRPIVSSFQLPWAAGLDFAASVSVGELIFTSGQTGHRTDGTLPDGFEDQLRGAFENLDVVLRADGGSLDSIVRLTTFLARAEDYAAFKRLRTEYLRAPFPASTGLVVGMLIPGMLIEIEAIAVRGPGRARDASRPS